MKYKDEKGDTYEISYSQELQRNIVKELKKSQKLQKTSITATMIMIVLFAIVIIAIIFAFIYLDQRDAITHLGRLIFC